MRSLSALFLAALLSFALLVIPGYLPEKAHVVIIGAGAAGMQAALECRKFTKSLVLLEKMPYVGGNSAMAMGGLNAAVLPDDASSYKAESIAAGKGSGRKELIEVMIRDSSGILEELRDWGADLSDCGVLSGHSTNRTFRPSGGAPVGKEITRILRKQIEKHGIDLRLENKATLIRKNSRGFDVVFENRTGKECRIKADAVIIASGGFGGNTELVVHYKPQLKGLNTTNAVSASGDYLRLTRELPVKIINPGDIQVHPTVEPDCGVLITEALRGNGGILLNSSGKRFTDEMGFRDMLSRDILKQKGGYAWLVFDRKVRKSLAASECYFPMKIVKQSRNLYGLAEKLSIPPKTTVETLARWNTFIREGEDTLFHRQDLCHPLENPPYYAIKVTPGVHSTMGGLAIDSTARVLDLAGHPVEGLYAAGEAAGGVHGKDGLGGNSLTDAMVFGKIAGKEAALWSLENEKKITKKEQTMAYKNLQEFITLLEKKGELKRIGAEVSPALEIAEICDRISKAHGPALLFEKVKGSQFPVLMNAFGSFERTALALGAQSLDEKAAELEELMEWAFSQTKKLDVMSFLPKLKWARLFLPSKVQKAPCQQVIDHDPDLNKLPVLTCWPKDGGPFFTLPMVITKDPDTGIQNMGMYRMQVFDSKTTGMHWHHHKDGAHFYQKYKERGQKMPVAVALGDDPAVTYAATAPLPEGFPELFFAGYLRGKPVETVKCITSELMVPAQAEFILEGWVDPSEPLRKEGPFGDHTGYYSLEDDYPVFHLECITHRKSPVFPATLVGQPPMEDCYMAKATERLFLPLLKKMNPEIVDMNLPLEGVFHNCAILSIKKRYAGHVHKLLNSLWGLGQMMYTKMIIVVDYDVDVQDLSKVMWKVFNNIDAGRDLIMSQGPLDALDHASPRPRFGTRLGIDATRKGPMDGHTRAWPEDIVMTKEIKDMVEKRWKEYGLD